MLKKYGEYIVGKPKSIEELDYDKAIEIAIAKQRKYFKIAVIDDEEFPKEDQLRRLSYNITKFDDLLSIDIIESYDIIVCDIKGVGRKLFGDSGNGGMLIEEIRKNYPNKYLIVYSGETHKVESNHYFKVADNWIDKTAGDNEKWTYLLDKAIEEVSNSVHAWKKIRDSLLKNKMKVADILYLETKFVEAVKNRNDNSFPPKELESTINPLMWKMLLSFGKSAALKLIF